MLKNLQTEHARKMRLVVAFPKNAGAMALTWEGRMASSKYVAAGLAILGFCSTALAQADVKPMKIWNLTASTIVDLRLAPSGSNKFGRNLTLDDKDKEIDVDERLTLRNVDPGLYDARVKLKNGRKCTLAGLKLEVGSIVSIEEKDLANCRR